MYKRKHTCFTYAVLGVLLTLVTSSCDTSSPEAVNYSGTWATDPIYVSSGNCCDVSVTITETGNRISGSGTIKYPVSTTASETASIAVAGTINDRTLTFNIALTTGESKGSFSGESEAGESRYLGVVKFESRSGFIAIHR